MEDVTDPASVLNKQPPIPPRRIMFSPFLTGDAICHVDVKEGKPFVVNLANVTFAKGELLVDYDHKTGARDIVGKCYNFRLEQGAWHADGEIISIEVGDLPELVIKQLENGYPYGCSARLELGAPEIIPEGASVEVNDRTINGPCYLYNDVRIKGISVVPYGAFDTTQTLLLSSGGTISLDFNQSPRLGDEKMGNEEIKKEDLAASDDTTEVTSETPAANAKDPALARLAELLGAEKALEVYQSGADIEEAVASLEKATEYGFSMAKLADCETDKKLADADVPPEDDTKKEDEKISAALSSVVKPLMNQVASLSKQVVNLSAKIGSTSGLSEGLSRNVDSSGKKSTGDYDREAEAKRLSALCGK